MLAWSPSPAARGRNFPRLPGEGPAVAAGVGAGQEHAGFGIALDDLGTAWAFEIADCVDRMTAARQLAADLFREAALHRQNIRAVMRVIGVLPRHVGGPARHLGGLLRV